MRAVYTKSAGRRGYLPRRPFHFRYRHASRQGTLAPAFLCGIPREKLECSALSVIQLPQHEALVRIHTVGQVLVGRGGKVSQGDLRIGPELRAHFRERGTYFLRCAGHNLRSSHRRPDQSAPLLHLRRSIGQIEKASLLGHQFGHEVAQCTGAVSYKIHVDCLLGELTYRDPLAIGERIPCDCERFHHLFGTHKVDVRRFTILLEMRHSVALRFLIPFDLYSSQWLLSIAAACLRFVVHESFSIQKVSAGGGSSPAGLNSLLRRIGKKAFIPLDSLSKLPEVIDKRGARSRHRLERLHGKTLF